MVRDRNGGAIASRQTVGAIPMESIMTNVTNGVKVNELVSTIESVRDQPELAKFRFSITNRWLGGGHNRSEVNPFTGIMQELKHTTKFEMDADEHPILLGNDEGANPAEYLLHALAACVTTSLVYHAAAHGILVDAVESTVEGDLDLRGFLGVDPNVRNGFQRIRITMKIATEADERQWSMLTKLAPTFSPVFDTVTRGVSVDIQAERM
jgi:uncharacterized OsmC-like protein